MVVHAEGVHRLVHARHVHALVRAAPHRRRHLLHLHGGQRLAQRRRRIAKPPHRLHRVHDRRAVAARGVSEAGHHRRVVLEQARQHRRHGVGVLALLQREQRRAQRLHGVEHELQQRLLLRRGLRVRGVVLQEEGRGGGQEAQHAAAHQTVQQARAGGHGVRAAAEERAHAGGGQARVALDLVRRGEELQQRLQQAARRQPVVAQHAVEVQQEGDHGAPVAAQQLQQPQRAGLRLRRGPRGQQRAPQDLRAAGAQHAQLGGAGVEEGEEGGGRVLQRQLVQHLQRGALQRRRRVRHVQQHRQRGLRPRQQLLRQWRHQALPAGERPLDAQCGDGGRGELQQRQHQPQRLLHRRARPRGPGR